MLFSFTSSVYCSVCCNGVRLPCSFAMRRFILVRALFLTDMPNCCFRFSLSISPSCNILFSAFILTPLFKLAPMMLVSISISFTVGSVFITFPCALPISLLCLNVLSAKIISCRSKPSGLIRLSSTLMGLCCFPPRVLTKKASSGAHDTLGTRRFD